MASPNYPDPAGLVNEYLSLSDSSGYLSSRRTELVENQCSKLIRAGCIHRYLLCALIFADYLSDYEAFVIYEYLITLDREVELFWSARSRSTGATVLFIVTRYWTLILRVLNMFGFMPMSNQVSVRCLYSGLISSILIAYAPEVFITCYTCLRMCLDILGQMCFCY